MICGRRFFDLLCKLFFRLKWVRLWTAAHFQTRPSGTADMETHTMKLLEKEWTEMKMDMFKPPEINASMEDGINYNADEKVKGAMCKNFHVLIAFLLTMYEPLESRKKKKGHLRLSRLSVKACRLILMWRTHDAGELQPNCYDQVLSWLLFSYRCHFYFL